MTESDTNARRVAVPTGGGLVLGAAAVVGMLILGKHNFLLFHALSEMLSSAAGWAVFLVVWTSRRFLKEDGFRLLAVAYLFVGAVDLLHTISYKGMGVFSGDTANLATQLWVGARYLEALSLLGAALLLARPVRLGGFGLISAAYVALTTGLLLTIWAWPVFPTCLVDAAGRATLTTFKVTSEYVIAAVLAAAGVVLYRARHRLDRRVFLALLFSIVLTIAAEMTFTLYRNVHDVASQTGHLLKIASFFLVYVALIQEGPQRPLAILFRDLKRHEEALAEKTRVAETLLHSMPCVAMLIRPSTREVLASNEVSEGAEGTPAATCFRTWIKAQTPCQWCLSAEQWAANKPQHKEIEHNGVVWDVHWMPVSDDLYLHYAFDITERNRFERQRAQLRERTRHTQKLESLAAMAGGIAHDFNNLLMVIQGNADLAMRDLNPVDPVRTSLEEIQKASVRASNLTGQMLAYTGHGRQTNEPTDLNELIERTTRELAASLSQRVSVGFEFAADLPRVEADPSQMRQMIEQLAINAWEAIGEDTGTVTFATDVVAVDPDLLAESYLEDNLPPGRYVCLTVTDTGSGMDEQTKERLFDPFFTTKETGRGLGMAAVLGIVRGHRGSISVTSEAGRGATLRVLLPCIEPTAGPRQATAEKTAGTILVVDDEPAVRNVACMMLQRAGYAVLSADDGAQAVEACRQFADGLDAVMLDVTMPGMSAEATIATLREIRQDLPVVLVSGHPESHLARRFADLHPAGFIQKPFEMTAMAAKLDAIVRRQASEVADNGEK